MSDNKSTIDIEVIMKNIRETIKEKGYTNEMLGFKDTDALYESSTQENGKFSYEKLLADLDKVNQNYSIRYYRNIGEKGVKSFIKKSLRKVLSFLILPMAEEQMDFNASVTRCLNQLEHFVKEQKERDYEELSEKLEKLEEELRAKKR